MPRSPIAGIVSGLWGLAWATLGIVLAAWAAATAIDVGRGMRLLLLASERAGIAPSEEVLALALSNVPAIGVAGVVALVVGLLNLGKARIAFRPATQSQDGKGELKLGLAEPRVGRPFEGSIQLAEAPMPGEEFDLVLAGAGGGAAAYRAEQKARTRQGAHGVQLPFRFDVPVTAPSGAGASWRLEFARAGKRFGRSVFDVQLAPPEEAQVRAASVPRADAHAPVLGAAGNAPTQQYVDQIEKLYGALGRRLTEAQRQRIRTGLSGEQAQQIKRQLDAFGRLRPEKVVKYVVVALVVVFFVIPIALSVVGFILAAVLGH